MGSSRRVEWRCGIVVRLGNYRLPGVWGSQIFLCFSVHVTFVLFHSMTLIILIYIFLVRSKKAAQFRTPSQPFVTSLFFVVSDCWALAEFPRWRMALFVVRECFFVTYVSVFLVSNVGFMVDKMSLAKTCLRALQDLPVGIIPPMVRTHSSFIPRIRYNLNSW